MRALPGHGAGGRIGNYATETGNGRKQQRQERPQVRRPGQRQQHQRQAAQ